MWKGIWRVIWNQLKLIGDVEEQVFKTKAFYLKAICLKLKKHADGVEFGPVCPECGDSMKSEWGQRQ